MSSSDASPRASARRETALSDERLVEALRRGDGRVGAELYDRVHPAIAAAVFRVLGPGDPDSDDLEQQCMEQLLVSLIRNRFAGACSLSTWASAIATRVALCALRSRRRRRRYHADAGADDEGGAELAAVASDDVEREAEMRRAFERVRLHLADMDEGRAMTLVLHDVLGHSLAEVALLTGASTAAAQSRLVRGRRELMRRFDGDAPGAARPWRDE